MTVVVLINGSLSRLGLVNCKHNHGCPSFSSLLPRLASTHRLQSQTPVVLQDEDILSDVVPSNIVSRQVSLFNLATRVFQGAEPRSSFSKDTPGDEVESEGTSERQEQDELMSEDDGVRAVFRNLSNS